MVRISETLYRRDRFTGNQGDGKSNGNNSVWKKSRRSETAAAYLEKKFGVVAVSAGIPMGIRETDLFFNIIEELTGAPMPIKYAKRKRQACRFLY